MYKYLTVSMELRQRSRSALLDAYRRFVVQELKSCLPPGTYAVWIAQSTLLRTEEDMASLGECAASTASSPLSDISFDWQTATMPEDLFVYDDDVDASETVSLSRTVRTESDGSPMQTPGSTCGSLLMTLAESITERVIVPYRASEGFGENTGASFTSSDDKTLVVDLRTRICVP
jgi:hypothetical protein